MKRFSCKKYKAFIVLLPIITGICLSGCVNSTYMRLGQQYASSSDWDKSVQAFQEALTENPDDPEIQLLLLRSKKNASNAHLANGEALLNNNRFDEAITEFQMSMAFDSSNLKAESFLKKAKSMKESDHYLKIGQNLEKGQNYSQAREAFQKAIELYPENDVARSALARYKKTEEKPPPKYPLNLETEKPISLKFKNTPILNIFEVVTKLTGVNFIFDKDVKETKATLFLSNVSFDEFMEIFLRTNQLSATMVNEKTLLVYPDTDQKAKEYEDLQIRTFYLAHLDVKKAAAMLSKILKSQDISENEALNALVIRGPKEKLEVASKILEANDRPSSEVTLNVEILEVSRTKEQQLGLDFPDSVGISLGGPTLDFYTPGSATAPPSGGASVATLRKISDDNALISIPTATLHLLKGDDDTKILAKPQIRVKNGEKAKIHIGERIPLRTNRRTDTTGAVTYDYQYQDVGIKLNAEPVINVHDEIVLRLTLEISSLGSNVGTTDDPQYSINTRIVESVMSVRTGESVIIGGLISDEERKAVRKIPFLGEIPLFGYIFSNFDIEDLQKDILMAITPLIIRSQEIPDASISQVWSGKEKDFSLKGPYEGPVDQDDVFRDHPMDEPEGLPDEALNNLPEDLPATAPPGALQPEDERESLPPLRDDLSPPPQTSINNPEEISRLEPNKAEEKMAMNRKPSPEKTTAQGNDIPMISGQNPFSFTIQVNSYIHKKDAEERVKNLTQLGYDCFSHSGYIPSKDRVVYRVFVGKFTDLKSAKNMCKEMMSKKDFRKDIYVVNYHWALGE